MKSAKVMRQARRHRVELLLLGMVLARNGDREFILEALSLDEFHSPLIKVCLNAIKTQSQEDIAEAKEVLRLWGVKAPGTVRDALIKRLKEYQEQTDGDEERRAEPEAKGELL